MNTQSEYMSNKSGHTDTLGEPCLKTFCINQACFNVAGFATYHECAAHESSFFGDVVRVNSLA